MPKVLVSVMQRPPTSSAASSTTKRLPAAASRRPAAMPAAPAPTTTASTQPERGTSVTGAARGAPSAGAASAAPEEARNHRRLKILIGAPRCYVFQDLPWKACRARVKSSSSFTYLRYVDGIHVRRTRSDARCVGARRASPTQPEERMQAMIDAAAKALAQMFSPPLRWVLLKSAGLALAMIVLLAIALHRLLVWAASAGANWAQDMFGISAPAPISILIWVVSVAAGVGIIVGSVFLMPAVTALVGSFFVDDIALEAERTHYPADVGIPLPLLRALVEGMKTALLAVLVYLVAVPFLLFAGPGVVIFFLASAYLLGREYFELAAMRHQPMAEAKRLRKTHQSTVFLAGMFIAAFVSIPIVNLATPLFAMAFMVHVHQRIMHDTRLRLDHNTRPRIDKAR